MRVRPYVVLLLLHQLIDQGHEVFRNKGSALALKEKMKEAVEREYPEEEGHLPPEEREGTIPASVLAVLQDVEASTADDKKKNRGVWQSLVREKNATPGNAACRDGHLLDDVPPLAISLDRSTAAVSDPATLRASGIERFGDLHISSSSKWLVQWTPKYFSQVLPFVMPRMVSGPDYDPDNRWRRRFEDAPFVGALDFFGIRPAR